MVYEGKSPVRLDQWVPYSDLGTWTIPEPGSVILLLFAAGGLYFLRVRQLSS